MSEGSVSGGVRPLTNREIRKGDVLLTHGNGVAVIMLVERIVGEKVIGCRLYRDRLIPWETNLGNCVSSGVLREEGGLAWLIAECALLGESIDLNTIAGEQEELLRLIDLPPMRCDRLILLQEEAVPLIVDPVKRFRHELRQCVRGMRNPGQDDLALVARIDSVDLMRETLGMVSVAQSSGALTLLLERFATLDKGELVRWALERSRAERSVEGIMAYFGDDFAKRSDMRAFMQEASLRTLCEVASLGRYHRMGPGHWIFTGARDGNPIFALFLYFMAFRDHCFSVFPIAQRAKEGLQMMESGLRPEVPWSLATGEESDVIDVAWCVRHRSAIDEFLEQYEA